MGQGHAPAHHGLLRRHAAELAGLHAARRRDGHPRIRPDRGCHCRWPGWTRIFDEDGLARSMPGKGCSLGSARRGGFFGRLETELFHGCGWAGVTLEEFMDMLDACLRWYGMPG